MRLRSGERKTTPMQHKQKLLGWKAMQLAEAAGISYFTMLYDEDIIEPMRFGAAFPNLKEISFLAGRDEFPMLDFGRLPPGWRECGIMGTRPQSGTDFGRFQTGTMAWVLLFAWDPVRSAFDAFLEAQEALRPRLMSLTPDFILPGMYLTRMAPIPSSFAERGPAAQWLSCFAQAQRRLFPLMSGLYTEWVRGSSQAAARYRTATGLGYPPFAENQQQALARWKNLFGTHLIDQCRSAERIEPVIIRGLEEGSGQLWNDRALHVPQKLQGFAAALLPIARWRPEPPGPEHLEVQALDTLDALTQAWEDWRSEE